MAGGGGGQSQTTSEASYPSEFRPLATSAVNEIQALQKALPLVSHAQFQPAGVAGLSPIEQFTINEMVMRTPYLPASFENLMQLPEPVGIASKNAASAGEQTKSSKGALDYLTSFLGRDVSPAPSATMPMQVMTKLPMPDTAFPGLSRSTLEAARPNIANQPVPMIQPIPQAPALPPPVAAPSGPSGPDPAALNAAISAQLAKQQLGWYGQQQYDYFISLGVTPENAFQMARNEEVQAFSSGGTG